MADNVVGAIDCPTCQATAEVRRARSRKNPSPDNPRAGMQGGFAGALYVYCATCGPIIANAKGAQARIRSRAKFTDAELAAAQAAGPVRLVEAPAPRISTAPKSPEPAPAPAAPPPAAKPRPLFEW